MLRTRKQWPCVAFILIVAACSGTEDDVSVSESDTLDALVSQAGEREIFYRVDIDLRTPLSSGLANLYLYMNGEVQQLESRRFDNPNPAIHVSYNAPVSAPSSAILFHVVTAGLNANSPDEYLCFATVSHITSRHTAEVDCDLTSTVAYYLSATRIGQSFAMPFHDIGARLPLWESLVEAKDNDVTGFYVSVFGTVQNALVRLGETRFNYQRHSIRPVMETIVSQFIDLYQRQGSITATDLIAIANGVTDNSLPLERIIRFQTIFDHYAHVSDVELTNTGGSLTQRNPELELLTMSSELGRFFLKSAPYEMSDFRTHIVQNMRHSSGENSVDVSWDPIAHMYGYNVYFQGQHIGYSRVPGIALPAGSTGTVTVKAVGYAGEFDAVHHELTEPTLVAGTADAIE